MQIIHPAHAQAFQGVVENPGGVRLGYIVRKLREIATTSVDIGLINPVMGLLSFNQWHAVYVYAEGMVRSHTRWE